jgi:hypothetical protein
MISFVRKRAALRGPLGGSRGWTALWALLLGARLVRKLTHQKEKVVFTHTLAPGERLLIAGEDTEPRVIGGR